MKPFRDAERRRPSLATGLSHRATPAGATAIAEATRLLSALRITPDRPDAIDGREVWVSADPRRAGAGATMSLLITCRARGHRPVDWGRIAIVLHARENRTPFSGILDQHGQLLISGLAPTSYDVSASERLHDGIPSLWSRVVPAIARHRALAAAAVAIIAIGLFVFSERLATRDAERQAVSALPARERAAARQRSIARAETILARDSIIDTGGRVTMTRERGLVLPAVPKPPPEWSDRAVALLAAEAVDQTADVQRAMVDLRSDAERGSALGESSAPRLVRPVLTLVRSSRPRFTWTPVDGADRYTIYVATRDRSTLLLERDVGKSVALDWPATAVPLTAGRSYSWQVEAWVAGRRNFSPWEYFRVMDVATLSDVSALEREFGGSALMLATVYLAHGLYDEAAVKLAELATLNPASAAITKMTDVQQRLRQHTPGAK